MSEADRLAFDAEIKIFDELYNLRINSEDGMERLEKVASYLDAKMREVASNYINLSPKHIAVLAALNIAEEYMSLQEKDFERVEGLQVRPPVADTATLVRRIEAVLDEKKLD